jgi:hypothetical protein
MKTLCIEEGLRHYTYENNHGAPPQYREKKHIKQRKQETEENTQAK